MTYLSPLTHVSDLVNVYRVRYQAPADLREHRRRPLETVGVATYALVTGHHLIVLPSLGRVECIRGGIVGSSCALG